jgi:hypothetical protein
VKRYERRAVAGAPNYYTVSADGTVRKYDRRLTPTKTIAGLPSIDLGKNYTGHLLPVEGEHLLDEIVALAFHGRPDCPFMAATVIHDDGDVFNCHADNLTWAVCSDWLHTGIVALMRPDHIPPRRTLFFPRNKRRTFETTSG